MYILDDVGTLWVGMEAACRCGWGWGWNFWTSAVQCGVGLEMLRRCTNRGGGRLMSDVEYLNGKLNGSLHGNLNGNLNGKLEGNMDGNLNGNLNGTKMGPKWDPNGDQTGAQRWSGTGPAPGTQKVPKVCNCRQKQACTQTSRHGALPDFGAPCGTL